MDLSPVRREVLEALLLYEEPVKAAQVASGVGKEQKVVQMHLIGLVKMGDASSPQKGYYIISENGKRALGLPQVSRESAILILAPQSLENAFHFYSDIGKPLDVKAKDLSEFCDKIQTVNVDAVNFHFHRGDFEAWFKHLGDAELAKKIELLKKENVSKEEVPRRIHEIVDDRCKSLAKLVASPA